MSWDILEISITNAVRLAKRETDRLRSQTLSEAAATSNLALFKEMKNCPYDKRCTQQIPDELEGEVSFGGIIDKFRECYEKLYNSADTSTEMLDIKLNIDKIIKEMWWWLKIRPVKYG